MPHQSLKVAAINYSIGLTHTNELIQAARDALNDGVHSYSLDELAMHGCVPLFIAVLKELNIPILEPAAAIQSILESQLIEMIEGAAKPEPVLSKLSSLYNHLSIDWSAKVMQSDLEQLKPFLADYRTFTDYQLDLEYADSGPLLPDQNRIDELNADALKHAEEWCRKRWKSEINPNWITSSTLAIVNSIRNSREYFSLPILADNLQEAGCNHEFILDHFRTNRPHAHRCFFVDLLIETSIEVNSQ